MTEFRKNFKGTVSFATAEEEAKFIEKEGELLTKKKLKHEKMAQEGKMSLKTDNKIEEEKINVEVNDSKISVQIESVNVETTSSNQIRNEDTKNILQNESTSMEEEYPR